MEIQLPWQHTVTESQKESQMEFEIFDPHGVIEAWKNNELDDLTIVYPGGAQACLTQAVFAAAALDENLPPPKNIVGHSGGAYLGIASATKQRDALGVFKHNVEYGRFGFQHVLHPQPGKRRRLVDTYGIAHDTFKNHFPFNIQALRNASSNVFVGLTNAVTGEQKFKKANTHNDPYTLAEASSAMLIHSNSGPVLLDGEYWIDGGESTSIPLYFITDTTEPNLGSRNIIIVLAGPVSEGLAARLINNIRAIIGDNIHDSALEAYLHNRQGQRIVLDQIKREAKQTTNPDVKIAIVGLKAFPKGYGPACRDIEVLDKVEREGYAFFSQLLRKKPNEALPQAS